MEGDNQVKKVAEEMVNVPDPVLNTPKQRRMSFAIKAIILFLFGFIVGWLWITWGNYIIQPYGLDGLPFWRLLLPV